MQPQLFIYMSYNNTLPLGFMVNMSTEANWNKETGNPFTTQNSFVKTAIDSDANIFHQLQTTDTVGTFTAKYQLEEDDNYKPSGDAATYDVYFYCVTSSETLTVNITNGSITDDNSTTKTFSSTNQNYICHVGNVSAGSTITVTASDGQALTTCYAYAFDNDAWETAYKLLNKKPYTVEPILIQRLPVRLQLRNRALCTLLFHMIKDGMYMLMV